VLLRSLRDKGPLYEQVLSGNQKWQYAMESRAADSDVSMMDLAAFRLHKYWVNYDCWSSLVSS